MLFMSAKDKEKDKEKSKQPVDSAKVRSLNDAISQIEKLYGKGSVMTLGQRTNMKIDVVSSGFLSLDAALGVGGFPKGRIIEIFGHESSGKTTLALAVVASAQKTGGTCAFIDAEHALDPKYAKQLGVDVNNLILSQPDNGEQALEIADALIRSGSVEVLVIDSVAALVPKAELDGDMDQGQIGGQARLMSRALRKITASISRTGCVVIFINQIRAKISTGYGGGPSETTTGGYALKFYASVRVEVRKEKTIYAKEEPIGSVTNFKIVKNKVAPPFKKVSLEMLYGKGISKEGEILDVGEKVGVVQKSGAYYYYNNEKLGQGRENVREMLKNNQTLANELETKIREKFGEVPIDEDDFIEKDTSEDEEPEE